MFNLKSSFMVCVLGVGALAAGSAQASRVQWSFNVNAPVVSTTVSSGYVYGPAPIYYEPAPVYYEPAPIVVQRPPLVVYRQEPVPLVNPWVYQQPPSPQWRHHHHNRPRWEHGRDEYGDRHPDNGRRGWR
jgi:hypothetical protein